MLFEVGEPIFVSLDDPNPDAAFRRRCEKSWVKILAICDWNVMGNLPRVILGITVVWPYFHPWIVGGARDTLCSPSHSKPMDLCLWLANFGGQVTWNVKIGSWLVTEAQEHNNGYVFLSLWCGASADTGNALKYLASIAGKGWRAMIFTR